MKPARSAGSSQSEPAYARSRRSGRRETTVGVPRKLRKLGDLIGRSYQEIESLCGAPAAHHRTPDGGVSAQWFEPHDFAVSFDANAIVAEVREPKRGELSTSWRLRSLGNIVGMTSTEITALLGAPNSRSAIGGGTLLQWLQPGYHVALRFDAADRCEGITHSFANRQI
jgi:hypothetical protein